MSIYEKDIVHSSDELSLIALAASIISSSRFNNHLRRNAETICTAATKEEIRKAIIRLKNGTLAGPDDMPAEALKVNINTSMEMIYPLFVMI